jgi:hypothetical protein
VQSVALHYSNNEPLLVVVHVQGVQLRGAAYAALSLLYEHALRSTTVTAGGSLKRRAVTLQRVLVLPDAAALNYEHATTTARSPTLASS